MSTPLPARRDPQPELPPILAGAATPDIRSRVEKFFFSVASIFESWVTRRSSAHTQRAYREDVMSFVKFAGIPWPERAFDLRNAQTDRSTASFQRGDFLSWQSKVL